RGRTRSRGAGPEGAARGRRDTHDHRPPRAGAWRAERCQRQGPGRGRALRWATEVFLVTPRRRVGILISGRGSNMMALAAAARAPDYPAEIVCVVSDRPAAAGLAWAREQGIPAHAVDHRAYATREAFEDALHAVLEAEGVDLVACAGF